MKPTEPADSVAFALYVYNKAHARSLSVNVSKLHSLLYLCYGIHYATRKCALLNEPPIAGHNGPVFNRLNSEANDCWGGLPYLANRYQLRGQLAGLKSYDTLINITLDQFGTKSERWLGAWIINNGQAWQNAHFTAPLTQSVITQPAILNSYDVVSDFKEQRHLRPPKPPLNWPVINRFF